MSEPIFIFQLHCFWNGYFWRNSLSITVWASALAWAILQRVGVVRRNQQNVQTMADAIAHVEVTVVRGGKTVKLKSEDIVPGTR